LIRTFDFFYKQQLNQTELLYKFKVHGGGSISNKANLPSIINPLMLVGLSSSF